MKSGPVLTRTTASTEAVSASKAALRSPALEPDAPHQRLFEHSNPTTAPGNLHKAAMSGVTGTVSSVGSRPMTRAERLAEAQRRWQQWARTATTDDPPAALFADLASPTRDPWPPVRRPSDN